MQKVRHNAELFSISQPRGAKNDYFPPPTNVSTKHLQLLTSRPSLLTFFPPRGAKIECFSTVNQRFQQQNQHSSLLAHHFSLFPHPVVQKRNYISNFAQKKGMPLHAFFCFCLSTYFGRQSMPTNLRSRQLVLVRHRRCLQPIG